RTFANLPETKSGYIHRDALELELLERVIDDRHAVITLVGRGGIGKTSVALSVLDRVAQGDRFGAIFWFSARDIDLLPQGPRMVRPHLRTVSDIGLEFSRLMAPTEAETKGFKPEKYLADALTKSPIQTPFLYVFDNFETARNPLDLFKWLDTYIRLPNKILI